MGGGGFMADRASPLDGFMLSLAFGLAVLALKIGVVVAIGYGVVKLVGGGRKKSAEPQISEADRRWLES